MVEDLDTVTEESRLLALLVDHQLPEYTRSHFAGTTFGCVLRKFEVWKAALAESDVV